MHASIVRCRPHLPQTIDSGRRIEVAGRLRDTPVVHLPKPPARTCRAEAVGAIAHAGTFDSGRGCAGIGWWGVSRRGISPAALCEGFP